MSKEKFKKFTTVFVRIAVPICVVIALALSAVTFALTLKNAKRVEEPATEITEPVEDGEKKDEEKADEGKTEDGNSVKEGENEANEPSDEANEPTEPVEDEKKDDEKVEEPVAPYIVNAEFDSKGNIILTFSDNTEKKLVIEKDEAPVVVKEIAVNEDGSIVAVYTDGKEVVIVEAPVVEEPVIEEPIEGDKENEPAEPVEGGEEGETTDPVQPVEGGENGENTEPVEQGEGEPKTETDGE